MAKATTTITFADGDQVTSTKLNQIISGFSLSSDSVDATTVTQSSGVLSVGTLSAANYGALSVGTSALAATSVTAAKLATDAVETAKIKDAAVTTVKIADANVSWAKTLTADRAVQADMQSETASHFVAPDVLKYHPGVAKAYGIVSAVNGSATLTGGYNITSATESGADRVIALSVTMANTNYVVLAAYEDTTSTGNAPAIHTKTTTGFSIGTTEAAGRKVVFTVFGQLA
jgi:hypothetical protein